MKRLSRYFAFLLTLLCLGCQPQSPPTESPSSFDPAQHKNVALVVEVEGSETKTLELPELFQVGSLPELNTQDSLFGEQRRYAGLSLEQLKTLAQAGPEHKVLRFHCRDGYTTEVETRILEQGQFLLAVRDVQAAPERFLDYDQMTYLQTEPDKLKQKMDEKGLSSENKAQLEKDRKHLLTLQRDMKNLRNPGPFYPIYLPADTLPKEDRWFAPFCVDRVRFSKKLTDKSRAVPDRLKDDHPVMLGRAAFESRCSTCHAVNGIGGEVGPELNFPQSVTEYWKEEGLRQVMKDPSMLRYNSKMPAFHLKDEDIESILAYLSWMAQHKKIDPKGE